MRSFSILCAASTLLSAVSGSPILDASKKGSPAPSKWSSSSSSTKAPSRTSSSSIPSRTASKDVPKHSSRPADPDFSHGLPLPSVTIPTTPCTPSSTNYLVNPGFDDITGDVNAYDPWTFTGAAAAYQLQSTFQSPPNSFGAAADNLNAVDGTLSQTITLPADTVFPFVVTCDGYLAVQVTNGDVTGTMEMYINGVLCGSRTVSTSGSFSLTPFMQMNPQGSGVTITDPVILVEVTLLEPSASGTKFVLVDTFAVNRDFTCPTAEVELDVPGLGLDVGLLLPEGKV